MSSEVGELSPLAAAALAYAARGWCVHPLHTDGKQDREGNLADKTPATRKGFLDATADKSRVQKYWKLHPAGNIGIACGSSGLVTVDEDHKNGVDGAQSLLNALGRPLPPTLVSRTPSGGFHWVYKEDPWIEVKSSTNLLPGVDIRAKGGYIVAPPSVSGGRPYAWIDPEVPTQPVPWEILSLTAAGGVLGRNDFLAKVLGPRLRNAIDDGEQLFDEMMKGNVRYFTRHPEGVLGEAEVRKIADSVMRNMEGGSSSHKLLANDEENGARLFRLAAAELRWVWQRKRWYYWGGHRWVADNDETRSMTLAVESTQQILEELRDDMPSTVRDKIYAHYKYSRSLRGLQNALVLLRRRSEMCLDATSFDQNPWLLGVGNGVIELVTGTHREGIREDLITRVVTCDWVTDATCPRFEKFVTEICVDSRGLLDPALVDWLWRFFGYCLTGATTEQCFVFAWGKGANGKSTLIETIASLAGDYAQTIPVTVLTAGARKSAEGNTPETAKLVGARLVQSNETSAGQAFSTADIKNLTGSDKITAQAKFEHPVTFIPHFKMVVRGNDRPSFGAMDEGFKRRLFAVPFFAHFPPEHPSFDPHLQAKLLEELPGILNWCIAGCLEWQKRPLSQGIPACMRELRAEWIEEQVTFGDFIRDCCKLEEDAVRERVEARTAAPDHIRTDSQRGAENLNDEFFVEPKALYDAFCLWARNQPGMRMSTKQFRAIMEGFGHGVRCDERIRIKGENRVIRAYTGLKLLVSAVTSRDF